MARISHRASPPDPATVRRLVLAVGAMLGALLWLALLAFGLDEAAGLSHKWRWPLMPAAAVLGAALGLTRLGRRLLWGSAALALLVIVLVGATPIIGRPVRALIRTDALPAAPLDGVIVLSAAVTPDGYLSDQALDRLLAGLGLVRRGVAPRLVLSRVRFVRDGQVIPSDGDQRRIISLLGDSVAVTVVDSVYSTRHEAVRMRALAATIPLQRVALVTSPTHSRRACATFEKVGFTVVCVPSESRDVALRDLLEVEDRMAAFRLWVYERIATTVYRARGWI